MASISFEQTESGWDGSEEVVEEIHEYPRRKNSDNIWQELKGERSVIVKFE